MRHRSFGHTDVQVPIVGQGTWQTEHDDRGAAVQALRRGLDLGLTHIDTAEMYGGGAVEELVADAIADRRDEVFLVSKVLPSNATRAGTIAACERSLRRLRTDRLDLYLLHWPGSHPLEDTIAAFEDLVVAGKIRAWGVSNFDEDQLAEAVTIARGYPGAGQCACDQVLYHVSERTVEHRVLPACAAAGVALVAYSPLGAGRFPAPSTKSRRVLDDVGRAHGVGAHEVALAFLFRHDPVFVIPKAARVDHVEALARAADVALTADDVEALERVFPLRPHRLGVPVL